MSLLNKLQSITGFKPTPPKRKTAQVSGTMEFLETSRLIAGLIFVATVAAIVLISFVGVNTASLPVLPNQYASVRIVASAPFTFESTEKTRLARDQLKNRVPPVYRIELDPLHQFETNLRDLLVQLEKFDREHPANAPSITRQNALTDLTEAFNNKGAYRTSPEDIAALLAAGDAKTRFTLVENGLVALREIYTQGVQDERLLDDSAGVTPGAITVFQVRKPGGDVTQRPVQSLEDALTFLRINLAAEGMGHETATALFPHLPQRRKTQPQLRRGRHAHGAKRRRQEFQARHGLGRTRANHHRAEHPSQRRTVRNA